MARSRGGNRDEGVNGERPAPLSKHSRRQYIRPLSSGSRYTASVKRLSRTCYPLSVTAAATLLLLSALVRPVPSRTPTVSLVPEGVWGGTGIRIDVREGDAEVELDAAHGKTAGPLVLDASGAFDVAGTFAREKPGPTRVDAPEHGEPARFRGTLEGDVLTLTVTLGRNAVAAGPLKARRGAPARLRKMY
jgi:hypothetical protein